MARRHTNNKKHPIKDKTSSGAPVSTVKSEMVGSVLRARREELGLSLEDIHEKTRISRNVLEALEADDMDSLPPTVYVRGFVRQYARILGLNDRQLLDMLPGTEPEPAFTGHRAVIGMTSDPLAVLEPSPDKSSDEDESSGVSSALVAFLIIIFLSLLASYIASQEESKSSLPSPSAQEITTYDVSG